VAAEGIVTIVANGRYPLLDVLQEQAPRTLFRASA
jgi:hypothetical protein